MRPYPRADWVRPLWWASGTTVGTTRRRLAELWARTAREPKPRVKEFGTEIRGWLGDLSRDRPWVRAEFGATAAMLAGTDNKDFDVPEGWLAVSRLCGEYADPLARFTAAFAAAMAGYRPRHLPNTLCEAAREWERAVPPRVRAAMVHAGGGVIDTRESADAFVADPDRHHPRYLAAARRAYATILTARAGDIADDQRGRESFADALTRLGVDDVEPPRPRPERSAGVTAALAAELSARPWLRGDPDLGEAYRRAEEALARRLRADGSLTDARILLKTRRHAEIDRRRGELRRHDTPTEDSALAGVADRAVAALGRELPELGRVHDADILHRAHARLARIPLPGPDGRDSWEKILASAVLAGAESLPATDDLAALVRTRWRAARGRDGTAPPGAAARSMAAATRLVDALLVLAVAQVAQLGDVVDPYRQPAALARLTRRYADAEATLGSYESKDRT